MRPPPRRAILRTALPSAGRDRRHLHEEPCMNFVGLAAPLSPTGAQSACDALGIDLPTLWAVTSVETRSCGFFPSRRPQILYERHVFHRLTNGAFDATAPALSNPTAGGYDQPSNDQYARLEAAMALDEQAALRSASWGIGQVMGFNAAAAGFADVDAMVAAFLDGEDAQLDAAATFIASQGLAQALQGQDWAGFARGYNGPSFAVNDYDGKLRLAHARFTAGPLPDLHVRGVQMALMLLSRLDGHGIDGLFGKVTQAALVQYQRDRGLPVSGLADDATVAALVAEVGWAQA
jgi:peptidoglycan hydrolase-like protein with peptidoglycan-binding domain